MLGTIVAIILPFVKLSNSILIVLKIILGICMSAILKNHKSIKQLFITFVSFLTYTFILGGMCFGLMYLLGVETTFSGIILFGFEIPVGLFVLLGVMYLKILTGMVGYIKDKYKYKSFYFDVTLKNNDNVVHITGFLDSGNQVVINNDGIPIINYRTILKLCPNFDLKNLIMGNLEECNLKNAKFVNLINSSGKSKMITFDIDEMDVVDDKGNVYRFSNQKVGLAKCNFGEKFDCLLSIEMFD